jgi:hypothetical protein
MGQYDLQKWYPMVPMDENFSCPNLLCHAWIYLGYLVSQLPSILINLFVLRLGLRKMI